ncbi:hypothetical protein J4460_07050 [Candidatus Woesearchaeota archaeon]|nr:MAG: hypothetical protein QS99_C0019G0009 [archaeon GW2011_AR4]MBS3130397.1 hypothetical protein [Candidatus Woesearchaeota archaeon]HIH38660.1 hypothetical protein [Candidatus Woesearchaeota archaeon]HIH49340.1 hypothetical protein [Candidatus Woesearchaeota archaeon]HIJ03546.1 hypothetical protein [Candidatus Woesearchaeota archaeon]
MASPYRQQTVKINETTVRFVFHWKDYREKLFLEDWQLMQAIQLKNSHPELMKRGFKKRARSTEQYELFYR